MAKSGTFSKTWASGWWSSSSNSKSYNISGNWARSGNTITLSGMQLWMTFKNASTAGGITDKVNLTGGSQQTVTWKWSGSSTTSNKVGLNNVSYTVGATDSSKTFYVYITGETTSPAITISFDKQPSSLNTSVTSIAWDATNNRMNITGSASCAWNGTGRSLQFIVNKAAGSLSDRWAFEVATTGTSGSKTCYAVSTSNHNSVFNSNGNNFPIKGCMTFYPSVWAANTADIAADWTSSTAQYTPPAPMTALSKTGSTASNTANSVTHAFSTTGNSQGTGTTGNNYNVNVTTQYNYTTDNGTTWSGWKDAGTGLSDVAKTFSFTAPYGSTCNVKTRQVYQGKASAEKTLGAFTTQAAVAPSGVTASVTEKGKDYFKIAVATTNYGTPNAISNRYIEGAIAVAGATDTYRYTKSADAATSATVTINNSSSIKPSGGSLTITPNTKYVYRALANNIVTDTRTTWTEVITLPPDLSTLTYSNVKPTTATVSYTYTKAGSALTESIAYTINGGAEQTATASTSGTISLTGLKPSTTYTIVARLKTTSGYGASKTVIFTTAAAGPKLKVNGEWKQSTAVFVKVNGTWKEGQMKVKSGGAWKDPS